jgi:UrcA family protein
MDMKLLQGSPFRSLIVASVAGLLGIGAAGASQSEPGVPSITVSYRDLELTTIEGANTLYRRMRGAARSVCGEQGHTLFEQQAWQACVRNALERGVAAVNNPLLTSVHTQASHGSV